MDREITFIGYNEMGNVYLWTLSTYGHSQDFITHANLPRMLMRIGERNLIGDNN